MASSFGDKLGKDGAQAEVKDKATGYSYSYELQDNAGAAASADLLHGFVIIGLLDDIQHLQREEIHETETSLQCSITPFNKLHLPYQTNTEMWGNSYR